VATESKGHFFSILGLEASLPSRKMKSRAATVAGRRERASSFVARLSSLP
jgi:hypothetical protein